MKIWNVHGTFRLKVPVDLEVKARTAKEARAKAQQLFDRVEIHVYDLSPDVSERILFGDDEQSCDTDFAKELLPPKEENRREK